MRHSCRPSFLFKTRVKVFWEDVKGEVLATCLHPLQLLDLSYVFRITIKLLFLVRSSTKMVVTAAPTVTKRPQAEIESVEGIPDLKIIRPKAFPDDRGFFCESYNCDDWAKTLDFHEVFKQVCYFSFLQI